ncbi:MAG: hypothetical protein J5J00_09365 [Deltaproteobacteria bacterium]|nr:hypothetical protein [Deltaproteobacteria bacterium]
MALYFEIPSPIIFAVSGRDSTRYLNARLTNDIKTIPIAGMQEAAMLSPQGRTEGIFKVVKLAAEEYLLICDGGSIEGVESALKRYLVADRVDVSRPSGLKAFHFISTDSAAAILKERADLPKQGAAAILESPRLIAYQIQRSYSIGVDVIVSSQGESLLKDIELKASLISEAERQLLRIKAGIPSFPEELNSDYLFAESGLERLVSRSKGCYVGQEVLERVSAIGKVPRLLKLIAVEPAAAISPGAVVTVFHSAERQQQLALGKVISSCYDAKEGVSYCFASLKNDPDLASFNIRIDGTAARLVERQQTK